MLGRALVDTPTTTLARRASERATFEDNGSLYGRLVPWGVEARVSDDGRRWYTESWARGGLRSAPGDVIPVYAGHVVTDAGLERGPLVGRVADLDDRDDGMYGRVLLADTAAAQELRSLAELVGATFSVEFADTSAAAGSTIVRTASTFTGLAVLTAPDRGAFAGAEVLSVRAAGDEDPGDDGEEGDGDEGDQADDAGDAGDADGGPPLVRARIEAEVRRALGRVGRASPPHPLARFGTAFDFHAAARLSGDDELPRLFARAYAQHQAVRQYGRALVDQVTTDNPGVIPPAWLNEVFGIIDMGRPVITAIGPRPLPPSGMELDWPYFDGDLHALVGVQATEKSDIVSVKVSLKKGSEPLVTYAGGSDISWQLIRRSQPSYREAYLRIMQAAYAVVTDAAASAAIEAVVGGTVDWDPDATDPDGSALRGALFAASAKVQVATGQPASFVLAATDVFTSFGAMPGLVPSAYGTQNVTGTAQASSLDVNVSGLSVVLAPDLTAGTVIVSNRLACSWPEDGPFVVAAPDVPKLGENVAIWGMGAFATFLPQGVVKLTDPTPIAATTTTSKSK